LVVSVIVGIGGYGGCCHDMVYMEVGNGEKISWWDGGRWKVVVDKGKRMDYVCMYVRMYLFVVFMGETWRVSSCEFCREHDGMHVMSNLLCCSYLCRCVTIVDAIETHLTH